MITTTPVQELRPAEYNPRIMPEHEMTALKKSIASFGFIEPIITNLHVCDACGDRRNVVIGGHQRLNALLALKAEGIIPKGVTEKNGDLHVPTIQTDLHIAKEKALNLALNKVKGRFDTAKLKHLLSEIINTEPNTDLLTTGFTPDEITNLLAPIEIPEEQAFARVPIDDVPEVGQMTINLHRDQLADVREAIARIRTDRNLGAAESPENSDGDGIAALAAAYLEEHHETQEA